LPVICARLFVRFVPHRKRFDTEKTKDATCDLSIKFLLEKAAEAKKQNEERREKPKPEEQEGMPQQRRH
jgi:hypothetical protein